ncbi:uncharacterized protein LOC143196934 [Rhynchophorus ferrugineus]|uniref:Uncharacterized protein n=1 Tax=Rhynchophorus ferrugineus TaxID=354439 RepID=A0A834M1J3_RHYFE|nr:hypothetical protein GWI33_019264 [Rhynchophorus ferrugineus]
MNERNKSIIYLLICIWKTTSYYQFVHHHVFMLNIESVSPPWVPTDGNSTEPYVTRSLVFDEEYFAEDVEVINVVADAIGDIDEICEVDTNTSLLPIVEDYITKDNEVVKSVLPNNTSGGTDTKLTVNKEGDVQDERELILPMCKIADEEDNEEVDIRIINLIADAMKDYYEDIPPNLISSNPVQSNPDPSSTDNVKEKYITTLRQQKLEKVSTLFMSCYNKTVKDQIVNPSKGIIEDLVYYISNLLGNTGSNN